MGLLALEHPARVIGVDVDAQPERVRADVCRVGRQAADLLGIGDRWRDERVEVAAKWGAGAYGVADATTEEAIRLAARYEALALDPVYSGKAFAGLLAGIRSGEYRPGQNILFVMTGGTPGLFAYRDELANPRA